MLFRIPYSTVYSKEVEKHFLVICFGLLDCEDFIEFPVDNRPQCLLQFQEMFLFGQNDRICTKSFWQFQEWVVFGLQNLQII